MLSLIVITFTYRCIMQPLIWQQMSTSTTNAINIYRMLRAATIIHLIVDARWICLNSFTWGSLLVLKWLLSGMLLLFSITATHICSNYVILAICHWSRTVLSDSRRVKASLVALDIYDLWLHGFWKKKYWEKQKAKILVQSLQMFII